MTARFTDKVNGIRISTLTAAAAQIYRAAPILRV
jgi:hypothetical protein